MLKMMILAVVVVVVLIVQDKNDGVKDNRIDSEYKNFEALVNERNVASKSDLDPMNVNFEINKEFWTNIDFHADAYIVHDQFVTKWKAINYGVNLFDITINRSYMYSIAFLLISQPIIFGIDWLVDEY